MANDNETDERRTVLDAYEDCYTSKWGEGSDDMPDDYCKLCEQRTMDVDPETNTCISCRIGAVTRERIRRGEL